jgi:predicted DNA-binding transcriptional regulator AlpA
MSLDVMDDDDIEFVTLKEACRIMGGNKPWHPSTYWRKLREPQKYGDLPKPVRTGHNQVRFVRRELLDAKRRMVAERDDPAVQAEIARQIARGNEARARARAERSKT